MKPDTRLSRAANTANLTQEQPQFGLRYGIVVGSDGDTISVETAEGETVSGLVSVIPTLHLEYPLPETGSVVLWGFVDGLAEQPFYIGVVRGSASEPRPKTGKVQMYASEILLEPSERARVKNKSIMVLGGQDSDGDIMTASGQ